MLERAGVSLVGEHVRHIAVGRVATAEISAVGFQREDIDINILSPSKVPVLYRWVSRRPGPTAHHSVAAGGFATIMIRYYESIRQSGRFVSAFKHENIGSNYSLCTILTSVTANFSFINERDG